MVKIVKVFNSIKLFWAEIDQASDSSWQSANSVVSKGVQRRITIINKMGAYYPTLLNFLRLCVFSVLVIFVASANLNLASLEWSTKIFAECNLHVMFLARQDDSPLFTIPVHLFISNHQLNTVNRFLKSENCRANIIFPVERFTPDFLQNVHHGFGGVNSETPKGILQSAYNIGGSHPWYVRWRDWPVPIH